MKVSVDQDQDQIVNGAGQILDTTDYWVVRWTEVKPGFIDLDYRRDFADETEARAFAAQLERA